ncbi:hypothetical protein LP419_09415 [Massilia sp. H-1]|nr:hypothetical protein LP419_09415 [Massilia sp. H-1]
MLDNDDADVVLPFALVSSLANADWPGNIRQLRNVAQRCVLALRCGAELDLDSLLGKRGEADAAPEAASAMPGVAAPDATPQTIQAQ